MIVIFTILTFGKAMKVAFPVIFLTGDNKKLKFISFNVIRKIIKEVGLLLAINSYLDQPVHHFSLCKLRNWFSITFQLFEYGILFS